MHEKDKWILLEIKSYLRVGKIYKHGPASLQFCVENIKELETIINHFNKYPLITIKRADYELSRLIVEKIKRKEHLTFDGLRQILALKAAMNLGLSDVLKKAFPDVAPVVRPLVENAKIPDPNWLAGFTSAEGCFIVSITESKTKIGYRVLLIFQLTQHSRDEKLLISFISYLNCGRIYKRGEAIDYKITKLDDIINKIIPFFKKYQVRGVKALDFKDWVRAAELMKENKHLTPEGLERIRKIKAGMNRRRKI